MLSVSSIKQERSLPKDFSKRRGFFKVSKDLLDSANVDFMDFMGLFIIVRAEFMYHEHAMHYHACSTLFEPLGEGECTPEYTFIINKSVGGELSVKAIREEHGEKLLRLLRKIDV